MDILITLPKTILWADYLKELKAVEAYEGNLNFKVHNLPVNASVSDRCYLLYKGMVRGWMHITGLKSGSFTCKITGVFWEGNFIQRSGPFIRIDPIPYTGFQGFRYYIHKN